MLKTKYTFYAMYRKSRIRLNYLLDRIIKQCNMVLMDVYRFPWPVVHNIAQRIARYIGDVCWLLRDFPRLSAYKLIGADWTIIFVGGDVGQREICHLFFEEEVDLQELGRIALWKLSAQTPKWLAEGVDLVVCELGRIHPRPPKSVFTFTVPIWIQQILGIPEPSESLLSGRRLQNIRSRLNKARQAEFDYRFSQLTADFDHFYYHMHVPFAKARHGHLALVAPYQDEKRWFARGGLLLVNQHDKPVAGTLCYVANDVCYILGSGVLDADPQLLRQEIITVLFWYGIIWGRGQGAKILDMGATRAWRSNGIFFYKQRWRAQVVRRKGIYGAWTFLAQNLSPSLQDHINELGFISEIDGRFYGVLLSTETDPITETEANKELSATKYEGLDGLVVISAESKPIVYSYT